MMVRCLLARNALWRVLAASLRDPASLARMARDTAGGVMIWTGVGLPVVLGISGLGLDVSLWYLERRVMQSAVDSAAISAAFARASGHGTAQIEAAVAKSFADSNFGVEPSDVLQVNVPPQTGPNTTNTTAVELLLNRDANLLLGQFVYGKEVVIQTRAVAGSVVVGRHCILALDKTAAAAVLFTGTADADIRCGVASNSKSSSAVHVGGKAVLIADPVQATGDIFVEGTATLETVQPPQPYSPPVTDPFGPDGRDLQMPPSGTCVPAPTMSGSQGNVALSPGRYCGDFLIENKNVDLAPGTYIIEGGDLRIKAGSVVNGDGVTFILTGSGPDDVGVFEFTSNSQVNISPPTTGDYAGVVLLQDPIAASNDGGGNPFTNYLYGGGDLNIEGAIYAPTRKVEFTGGSTAASDCIYIISRLVTITGNAVINNDPSECAGLGLDDIDQVRIRLIE